MKDHPPRLSKPVTCRVIAKANWCAVGRWPTRCPISMRVCTCKTSKKSEKWMKFWAKLMRFTSPSNWNLACKVKVFNPRIKFLLEQTNYCLLRGSQTPELLAVVVEVDAVVEEVAAVVDGEALEDEEDPAAAEDLADEEEDGTFLPGCCVLSQAYGFLSCSLCVSGFEQWISWGQGRSWWLWWLWWPRWRKRRRTRPGSILG
mmetsp:Transcript_13697/g.28290  ORF Transcript_13697/g.28290 Transcript_13697/m.28290 type:complete len:202 (+) Transcript_13697:324-929(+)